MDADRRSRIENLFHDAVKLQPNKQARFLDRECGDAPSIKAEIEELLRAHHAAGSFLVSHSFGLAGQTFGSYKLKSLIGAGGMGEVYRAFDSRLKREVAIKVLPREFSSAPDRVARFQREAEILASLNHPHIAAVYDLASFAGLRFLVLELVEGETLADRLARGPLAVAEALRIAGQIAEALEAAHEKGVIHRDLKPANIKITTDGRVKLLDFGLAKAICGDAAGANPSDSPTMVSATVPGTILGTAAYMSPEQVEGKQVDSRADIFAFGIVLYEMLAGKRPFHGETTITLLAAILKTHPAPLRKVRSEIPERIESVVSRCLEKEVAARYASAGELRQALLALEDTHQPKKAVVRSAWVVTAAAAVVVAAAAFGLLSYRKSLQVWWVEETAVPEIARLIQDDHWLAAQSLSREAEQYAPESRSLFQVSEGIRKAAKTVTFETSPPGARIYISDYMAGPTADLSQWQLLGESPLKLDQVPGYGYYRIRAVKDGFVPADRTYGDFELGTGFLVLRMTLQTEKSAPQGMVRIPDTSEVAPLSTAPVALWRNVAVLPLPAFFMDRYEVTNREFKRFVDAGGYRKEEYWKHPFVKDGRILTFEQAMSEFHDRTSRRGPATWQLETYPDGTEDMPVGGVSWYEASAYAEFAGKSLPTIYEWNYAAGVSAFRNLDIVRLSNFGGKAPAAIAAHQGMSPYGTYDMAGNLKEWTANATGAQRYILGGAWNEAPYVFPQPDARSAFARDETFGFRCVRRPAPPPEASLAEVTLNYDSKLPPAVSDETYKIFLDQHAYDKTNLDSKMERTDDFGPYWRRETVSFRAAYDNERVFAHLFLPKNTPPPYQVVIVMGGLTIVDPIKKVEDYDYPYEFIVRKGRAVVIPAYSGTLERGPSQMFPPRNQARDRALKWSKDLGRSVDYLETRPDIFDTHKLAFYGISSGAVHGLRFVAVDSRFKTAVLVSGGVDRFSLPEVNSWNFAPRVHIPVLMLNGRDDFVFPLESSQKLLFEAIGTKEPAKKHLPSAGGHKTPFANPEVLGEILTWLDRYLGSVVELHP